MMSIFANSEQLEQMINQYNPWAIINAAGYVNVDHAETKKINATGRIILDPAKTCHPV